MPLSASLIRYPSRPVSTMLFCYISAGTLLRTAAALNWDAVCLIRQTGSDQHSTDTADDADETVLPPASTAFTSFSKSKSKSASSSSTSKPSSSSSSSVFQSHCVDAMNPKAVAAARGAQVTHSNHGYETNANIFYFVNKKHFCSSTNDGFAPCFFITKL